MIDDYNYWNHTFLDFNSHFPPPQNSTFCATSISHFLVFVAHASDLSMLYLFVIIILLTVDSTFQKCNFKGRYHGVLSNYDFSLLRIFFFLHRCIPTSMCTAQKHKFVYYFWNCWNVSDPYKYQSARWMASFKPYHGWLFFTW